MSVTFEKDFTRPEVETPDPEDEWMTCPPPSVVALAGTLVSHLPSFSELLLTPNLSDHQLSQVLCRWSRPISGSLGRRHVPPDLRNAPCLYREGLEGPRAGPARPIST